MKRTICVVAAALGLSWAGAAWTDKAWADEVFAGVYAHNVTFVGDSLGIGAVKREGGEDIHLGYRTSRINALWWLGKPQVHAFISYNTNRTSDFAAAGFDWPIRLFRSKFYIRPGIGLAFTDGRFNLPPANAPGLSPTELAQRTYLHYHRLDFGDPWQFEPELAIGYHFTKHWSSELSYTHISNGQIFHHGDNEGLDDAGVRLIYKF